MLTNKQLKATIMQKNILNISLLERIVSNDIPGNIDRGIKHKGKRDIVFRIWSDEASDEIIHLYKVDAQVLNAVFTFEKYGVSEFSLEQLAGMIYGDFERRCRNEIKLVIAESVERLKKYSIYINAKQEFSHYTKLKGVNETFKGPLLDIDWNNCNGKNGKSTIVYRIRNISVIMQYAEVLNHIAKIDMQWYQLIPKHSSFEKIMMCEGLFCRIAQAKNPHNHMFKDNRDMIIFGWNKNIKSFSGIIGNHIKEFDKRKIESTLETLRLLWKKLEKEGVVSEFRWQECDYNFGQLQFRKVYISRRKKE